MGQSWNNIINTGLSKGFVVHTDVLANKHGINITNYDNENKTNYLLLTTSGTIIKQVQLDTEGYYPIIVGDDNNLFVVYVKNNSLKALRSTNLFTTWSNISPPEHKQYSCYITPV